MVVNKLYIGCEVKERSWHTDEILAAALLKMMRGEIHIKVVRKFSDDPKYFKFNHPAFEFKMMYSNYNIYTHYDFDSLIQNAGYCQFVDYESQKFEEILESMEPSSNDLTIWEISYTNAVEFACRFLLSRFTEASLRRKCFDEIKEYEDEGKRHAILYDNNAPWRSVIDKFSNIDFIIVDEISHNKEEKRIYHEANGIDVISPYMVHVYIVKDEDDKPHISIYEKTENIGGYLQPTGMYITTKDGSEEIIEHKSLSFNSSDLAIRFVERMIEQHDEASKKGENENVKEN